MQHYIVTTSVRHGEQVTERKHLIEAESVGQAEILAIEIECSHTGEELGEEDSCGIYSYSQEFHFSPYNVQLVEPEDVATLAKYFPIA